ncbi:hypothetical protein AB0L40_02215 [Patulibacter sp. NPDC049589]|uniref:hypothetical protein n=1 Tax=Patulibacter sp. NPDC049589 TaxID=3154731 RepID=UPI00342AC2B5
MKRPGWWPASRDDDGPRRPPAALTDEQRAALEHAHRALLASETVEAATHLGYATRAASADAHEAAETAVSAALEAGVSRALLESTAADAIAAVHGT